MSDKAIKPSNSEMPKNSSVKHLPLNQDASDFLLAEYERLQNVRDAISQKASRRFEFYLTITSAAIGALLVLGQTLNVSFSQSWFDLAALFFLLYGIITFLNLAYASGADRDLIVGFHRIQDFFIDNTPTVRDYLYFRSDTKPKEKYKFTTILFRGVGGGSEKAVISILNSGLFAYLIYSFLILHLKLQISQRTLLVLLAPVVLLSGIVHAIIMSLIYKYYRL